RLPVVQRVLAVLHALDFPVVIEPSSCSPARDERRVGQPVVPVPADDENRNALANIAHDRGDVVSAVEIESNLVSFPAVEAALEVGDTLLRFEANLDDATVQPGYPSVVGRVGRVDIDELREP